MLQSATRADADVRISLYKIVSFQSFIVGLSHPFIAPPTRIAHTVAILLHNIRPPSDPPVCTPYTIQYCALQYRVKAKIVFHFKAVLWEFLILLLPSPHQQRLPYCNTISRPLRSIRLATDPPFVCDTPYANIGDDTLL